MELQSYETMLGSGHHWSLIVRRGMQLDITDLDGGANVGLLFYNAHFLNEKYNAPDTLKCQHTFKLTKGHCLYSDMGRIFCSITEDSFGWHDSICGNSRAEYINQRWNERSYQKDHNKWHQNGHDSFLVEFAKYGLSHKDMAANLNVFSKVIASNEGKLSLGGRSKSGDNIILRFEMDTLLVLHTCPHPLNEDVNYPNGSIQLLLKKSEPVAHDDYCMNFRQENQRGFKNNALYHMGL